jgi:hypothetical protein
MPSQYLTTYRALVRNTAGREAIQTYNLPPFVDGSCRREPDFEAAYPSITAICRGRNFAPRLRIGDRIVYLSKKQKYLGQYSSPHWRLTSVLEVFKRFETHREAAEWYRDNGLNVLSNCMVAGNDPLPLDQTDRKEKNLKEWNGKYYLRARRVGVFLACQKLYMELWKPPLIPDEMLVHVFKRIPNTRNPPAIAVTELNELVGICGI